MKPDIVIRERNSKNILYILDTKWKLINQDNPIPKYSQNNQDTIKQADIYQLFTYGKKYGVKKLVLIYPKWDNFNEDFSFNLDDGLCLNIKQFNLDNDANNII
jgi:5-methylcytosine-specific restriction enzyme subunit McrC